MCKCTLKMHSSVKRKLNTINERKFYYNGSLFLSLQINRKEDLVHDVNGGYFCSIKVQKITSNVSYDKILRFLIKSKYAYL